MLAVGAGLVVALAGAWRWWRIVTATPTTTWSAAIQQSLWGLGLVSVVQSTVSHAQVGGFALLLLALWLVEQQHRGDDSG